MAVTPCPQKTQGNPATLLLLRKCAESLLGHSIPAASERKRWHFRRLSHFIPSPRIAVSASCGLHQAMRGVPSCLVSLLPAMMPLGSRASSSIPAVPEDLPPRFSQGCLTTQRSWRPCAGICQSSPGATTTLLVCTL